MTKIIHPVAGTVALLVILTFWISTLWSEVFASLDTIIAVKTMIPWGFIILLPALATVGLSGFRLSRGWRSPVVTKKQRRMPFIAANGIVILIPAAFYLSFKAQTGVLDWAFYSVQMLELAAGAVNIALLGLNMRDGLRLSGKMRRAVC